MLARTARALFAPDDQVVARALTPGDQLYRVVGECASSGLNVLLVEVAVEVCPTLNYFYFFDPYGPTLQVIAHEVRDALTISLGRSRQGAKHVIVPALYPQDRA